MDIFLVLYVLALLAFLTIVYAILNFIWYIVKMLSLSSFMKDLGKRDGVSVVKHRSLFKTCFGKKGLTDYTVSASGKEYEICVITFLSTRGRWNFEKDEENYFIVCRRSPKFFYKKHVHNEAPSHALDYKRETHFAKKPLVFSRDDEKYEKQIFLLYPWPSCVSHTDFQYRELISGDTVKNRVIMDVETFFKTVFPNEEE